MGLVLGGSGSSVFRGKLGGWADMLRQALVRFTCI